MALRSHLTLACLLFLSSFIHSASSFVSSHCCLSSSPSSPLRHLPLSPFPHSSVSLVTSSCPVRLPFPSPFPLTSRLSCLISLAFSFLFLVFTHLPFPVLNTSSVHTYSLSPVCREVIVCIFFLCIFTLCVRACVRAFTECVMSTFVWTCETPL